MQITSCGRGFSSSTLVSGRPDACLARELFLLALLRIFPGGDRWMETRRAASALPSSVRRLAPFNGSPIPQFSHRLQDTVDKKGCMRRAERAHHRDLDVKPTLLFLRLRVYVWFADGRKSLVSHSSCPWWLDSTCIKQVRADNCACTAFLFLSR